VETVTPCSFPSVIYHGPYYTTLIPPFSDRPEASSRAWRICPGQHFSRGPAVTIAVAEGPDRANKAILRGEKDQVC